MVFALKRKNKDDKRALEIYWRLGRVSYGGDVFACEGSEMVMGIGKGH